MAIAKREPLIIAGSGRSGTTWVVDILAEANSLRTVFEPLNPFGVQEASPFAYSYIRESDERPELKVFLERVFCGKLNYLWPNIRFMPASLRPSLSDFTSWADTHALLSRYRRFPAEYYSYWKKKDLRPIIKLIRANLMLDWIAANFDARIIFVVRHPGAVVASKIAASKTKYGSVWSYNGPSEQRVLSLYKNNEQFKHDYLSRYSDLFTEKLPPVAGHTLLWCLENVLPIRNLQKRKRYVFFYEDLITHPEREFGRMVKILGLKKEPKGKILKAPSQQASVEMKSNQSHLDQLSRWMKSFTAEQLAEMEQVLEFFKLSLYTAREPLPICRVQAKA